MFQRRTRATEVFFMCFILVAMGLPWPAQAGSMNSAVSEAEMSAQHEMIQQDIAEVKALVEGLNGGGGAPCGAGTKGQRFVENGLEVCDNTTGLYWVKMPDYSTTRTHAAAVSHCTGLIFSNSQTYRLPEIKELISLVDYSKYSPSFPVGHPFANVKSAGYWSASSSATSPTVAWVVHFNLGWVSTNNMSGSNYVWCARSGS